MHARRGAFVMIGEPARRALHVVIAEFEEWRIALETMFFLAFMGDTIVRCRDTPLEPRLSDSY
eukprot:811753-Prymnesium_polylepis.1